MTQGVWMGVSARELGTTLAAIVFAVLICLVGQPPTASAATSTPKLRIVFENPAYATLAVDSQGTSYGINTSQASPGGQYRLFSSADEGRNWTRSFDFPAYSRIDGLSILRSGTLLLHLVATNLYIYRSDNGGQTWTMVLRFPEHYGTLTPHSITDDGTHAYVGSFNTLDGEAHENWIWRSNNDGRNWRIIRTTTTHRHIHAVQVDPGSGALYALYGDTEEQAAIERSTNHGVTWKTVCKGKQCSAIDISFTGSGFALFGQDTPFGGGQIQRLRLADGTTTPVQPIPGPSSSALNLNGTYLLGVSREPNRSYPANDPNVHLYGSEDGGLTFSPFFSIPWKDPNAYVDLLVQYVYPNGDFPIQVTGYGTIVGRLTSARPAPNAATAPKLTHRRSDRAAMLRAKLSQGKLTVKTLVSVDRAATVSLTAWNPRTRRQMMLQSGSKLGATGIPGVTAPKLTAKMKKGTSFPVAAALKGTLARGATYELRLTAAGPTGKTSRLAIRFIG